MLLKKFAQSTVLLTTRAGKTLLIDPGKYNLDVGRLTADTFPTSDVIVITHKHADHFDLDLVRAVLRRSSPQIFTNPEIATILRTDGHACKDVSDGDVIDVAGFSLTTTPTDHVVRGELIVNFGLVIVCDGVSLYHSSDTRFIEPSLLPTITRARYLLIPISNRGVVMGIDDALVFANELKPRMVIPIHYDSPKDVNRVNPQEFVRKASDLGLTARVLQFGEEIELD